MKCAADKAYTEARKDALGSEYATLYFEFIDAMVSLELIRQHGWGKKRLQRMYDSESDYVTSWVERYATTGGYKKTRRGAERLDEGDCMRDTLQTTIYALDRELERIGFRYELEHTTANDFHVGWQSHEKRRATARMVWYADIGGDQSQVYVLALLMYLHEYYGFGAARLTRLFMPVSDALEWYVHRFLRGTRTADNDIKARLDAAQEELKKHGIEFVSVPAAPAEPHMRVAKPEKKAEIPQDMELLSWQNLRK